MPGVAAMGQPPFGPPSDRLVRGELAGGTVFFLPRHGCGHRLAPHELPHAANVWALRSLGVRWLFCVTAMGSLREELHPERYRGGGPTLRPDEPVPTPYLTLSFLYGVRGMVLSYPNSSPAAIFPI